MWLVNKFLKIGSVVDVPHSGRQKSGRSTANTDPIRPAILKSKEVYSWTFGRTQSKEISNSAQHLRNDLKKFPCKIQIEQNIRVADNKENHFL